MTRPHALLLSLASLIAGACSDATGTTSPTRMSAPGALAGAAATSQEISALAAAPWCGASAPLTGGLLPPGWSSTNSGTPGSGLLYQRANAQGGGWTTISMPGAVTAPLSEIRLNYVAYNDATFSAGASGMARAITLFAGSGIYQLIEGSDRYNAGELFFRSELVSVAFPDPSTSTVFKVVSKPASYGIYRMLVRIRNGAAMVQATDVLTGAVVHSTTLPLTGFTLTSVQSLQLGIASADNPVWFDAVSVSCI